MKTLSISTLFFSLLLFYSCGGNQSPAPAESAPGTSAAPATEEYDPNRGLGKHNEENLKLDATLNATMADAGEKIMGVKCQSCHKFTEERLVGPGLKGVTTRRTPFWIMNFITNPDPMIDKDPQLQAQLEICLLRMPNQSLTDEDARNVLEFLRKNDGLQ